jgi:hypothetical protein
MRVRLKVAATVPTVVAEGQSAPARHDWMPAGTECDLDEEHFDPSIHENLGDPLPPAKLPEKTELEAMTNSQVGQAISNAFQELWDRLRTAESRVLELEAKLPKGADAPPSVPTPPPSDSPAPESPAASAQGTDSATSADPS